jgi:hypothetical protein
MVFQLEFELEMVVVQQLVLELEQELVEAQELVQVLVF